MIIEGFVVENWSCIRRAAVENLPSSGVVVLHGPNRTGKSSLIAALRATLFDYQPTSNDKKLKRYFPNWDSDPPRVSVSFRVGSKSYRVVKQFKKVGDCRLEERTSTSWSVVTKTPAEVHDRTLELVGAKGSNQGLQQLLWLEQADFLLPEEKVFDRDVQTQLRSVLGVMQTPLDDSFFEKVQKRWKSWYTIRTKPGETTKRIKTCSLEKDLAKLDEVKVELAKLDEEYLSNEKLLERAEYLEAEIASLQSDIKRKESNLLRLEQEGEQSQIRLQAYSLAGLRLTAATKAFDLVKNQQIAREEVVDRLRLANEAIDSAQSKVDTTQKALVVGQESRDKIRRDMIEVRDLIRTTRSSLSAIQSQSRLIQQRADFAVCRENLNQAERLHNQLANLLQSDRDHPAPTTNDLKIWTTNRTEAARLRAELNVAAMNFSIVVEEGRQATMSVDDKLTVPVAETITVPVRHHAEVVIPMWGKIAVSRGHDGGSLDDMENKLNELDRIFCESVVPYGFTGHESADLEQLRERAAEWEIRSTNRKNLENQIKQLGATIIQDKISEFHRLETALAILENENPTASNVVNPSELTLELQKKLDALDLRINTLEADELSATEKLDAGPNALNLMANNALTELATAKAIAKTYFEELDRLPTSAAISNDLKLAEVELINSRESLSNADLTDEEKAIPELIKGAKEALVQIQKRRTDLLEELHRLEGALSRSEGLHQKRSEAEAVVELLQRKTQQEELEARAFDRLYQLFEECREKQLATVTSPITNRVLRWMRMAGIADYRSIECGDSFLPQKLASPNKQLPFEHESTGTQEQIGLMVRLALGSVIVPPGEPAVAILDDPLTHSDVIRMDRMRAILKSAAIGDEHVTPASGPLQILIFTCHPEWFQTDACTIIDLGNPDIMQRV